MECINPACSHVWYMPEDVYDNNTCFECLVCGKVQTKERLVLQYTEFEGGHWIPWPFKREDNPFKKANIMLVENNKVKFKGKLHFIGMMTGKAQIEFHELKFKDGSEWDCVNGFRIPNNFKS